MTQNLGAYRTSTNPHKAAYDREKRVERILERAPEKIRCLNEDIRWWSSIADQRANRVCELGAELARAKTRIHNLALAFVFALVCFGVLWVRSSNLASENASLRADLAVTLEERDNYISISQAVTEERDIARENLRFESQHSSRLFQQLLECVNDLTVMSHEVDALGTRLNLATEQQRLNDLRIDAIERDCFN